MEFYLNDEREIVRNAVREFTDREVRPLAEKIDQEDYFPTELFRRMGELGFLDLFVPEEYGGNNADLTTFCIVVEEVSKASATLGMSLIAHSCLSQGLVTLMPDCELKRRVLPELVSGQKIGCTSSTEPCGYGNQTAYATRAVSDGDDFVITGQKVFATNIGAADYYFVDCVLDEPGPRGLILVEKGTPGFTIGESEDKVGWRGSNSGTLYFDNVRVPQTNLVSKDSTIAGYFEVVACGACALGISEEAYDMLWNYAMQRMHASGKPYPLEYQVMRIRMMENLAKINAIRSMTYAETANNDTGTPNLVNGFLIKPTCFQYAEEITSQSMNLFGGVGVVKGTGIERLWRDAKVGLIGGAAYDLCLDTASMVRIAGLA